MGLQASYELREARRRLGAELEKIERYVHEGPVYDEEGNPFPEEEAREFQEVA
jgi:hypothetical protein